MTHENESYCLYSVWLILDESWMKISFYRIGSWFIIWILEQNRPMTHNLWVITIPEVHRKFILSLLYSFLFKYFIFIPPKSRTSIVRAVPADEIIFFLEFVCEDSFGVACPSGVDKDLWSRFQAFEKWNATHWVILMTLFQHVINPIFYLTWNHSLSTSEFWYGHIQGC